MNSTNKQSEKKRSEMSVLDGIDCHTPPPSFLCPISQELMCDPVMTSDGHSYERSAVLFAVERWLQSQSTSPVTNLPEACAEFTGVLVPNVALRKSIEEWKQRSRTNSEMLADLKERSKNRKVAQLNLLAKKEKKKAKKKAMEEERHARTQMEDVRERLASGSNVSNKEIREALDEHDKNVEYYQARNNFKQAEFALKAEKTRLIVNGQKPKRRVQQPRRKQNP